jgi:hypothetical protein
MPKVDKRPIGENSPNLATLLETDLKKNQPFFWKEHFAFCFPLLRRSTGKSHF